MKKILFVYLAKNFTEALNFPVGIYALKSYLELNYKNKCIVEIRDIQLEKTDDIVDYVFSWQPDILGLSLMIGASEVLDELIKKLNYQTKSNNKPLLVFGKNIATCMYHELLKKYPFAICVKGEGELAIGGLLEYICNEKQLSEVINVAYLEEGHLKENQRAFLSDLSVIGKVDYNFVAPYAAQDGNVWLEASRGCPWGKCTFCSIRSHWGNSGWREKPIETIINELKTISQFGVGKVLFTDEEFFGYGFDGLKRAARLATEILARGINVFFYINARVNAIYNKDDTQEQSAFRRDVLKHLQKAGLQMIYLGIDSGSASQLNRYNKGVDLAAAEEAIKICRDLNIEIAAGILIFEPLITEEEFLDNINFIVRNRILPYLSKPLNKLNFFSMIPYYDLVRNEEVVLKKQLLARKINFKKATFAVTHFKSEKIEKIVEFVDKYYQKEESLFDSLRWFLRFYKEACKEEFKYLKFYLELFKEHQISLLQNMSGLLSGNFIYGDACNILRDAYKKRSCFIVSLRREIVASGHSQICKDILNQIDKYSSQDSKLEFFEKIDNSYLTKTKVFFRYGFGASSALPTGAGHYGISLIIRLAMNKQLTDTISWIRNQIMNTKAFTNNKIKFVPDESMYFILKNFVLYSAQAISKEYIFKCYSEVKEQVKGTKPFQLNIDGVWWCRKYPCISLKTSSNYDLYNLNRAINGTCWPVAELKFAIVVWELTKEELNELNTLIVDLSPMPIGSFIVKNIFLLHNQNDFAINPLDEQIILFRSDD